MRTCNSPRHDTTWKHANSICVCFGYRQVKQKSETVDNNQLYRIVDSNRTHQNYCLWVACGGILALFIIIVTHHRRVFLVRASFHHTNQIVAFFSFASPSSSSSFISHWIPTTGTISSYLQLDHSNKFICIFAARLNNGIKLALEHPNTNNTTAE